MSIHIDRTEAIKSLKEPTSKIELQWFLGFVNYVRKLVINLADMSDPLINLLIKDVEWHWNTIHSQSLNKIKIN